MNLNRNRQSLVEALARRLPADTRSAEPTVTPKLTARVRRGLAALGKTPAAAKDLKAAREWLAAQGLEG